MMRALRNPGALLFL